MTLSASTAVPRRLPSRWLLVGVGAVVVTSAVYLVAVLTRPGQEIEDSILKSVYGRVPSGPSSALDAISVPAVLIALVVVTVVSFLRRRPATAIQGGALILGASVTAQVIKALAPRPELTSLGMGNSFPSGHATIAIVCVFAVSAAFGRHLRPFITLIGAAFAAIVAEQTVAYGWHRVSDICGACGVALLWLAIVRAVGALWSRDPFDVVGRRAFGFTSGLLGLSMVATLCAAGAVFAVGIGSSLAITATAASGVLIGARLLSAGVVIATFWLSWKLDRAI